MPDALFRRVGEVWLAHNATVTGDVRMGRGVNIWFHVTIRGDVAPITLEDDVNIQDGSIVHCDFDAPLVIERGVVAGHNAILHGIRIGADTLIGMGATLLTGTVIGAECVVAAGSVVPPGMIVPPRSVVMGVPGKIVRAATDEDVARTRATNRRYAELCRQYAGGMYAQPG
jgi:carbonic anhydrase/acetyltransferase-like protein (isoleucine patch superfamily)